eukprot:31002-Pelagococcus_subviridis.AAC.6
MGSSQSGRTRVRGDHAGAARDARHANQRDPRRDRVHPDRVAYERREHGFEQHHDRDDGRGEVLQRRDVPGRARDRPCEIRFVGRYYVTGSIGQSKGVERDRTSRRN